jgi:exonuclease 1
VIINFHCFHCFHFFTIIITTTDPDSTLFTYPLTRARILIPRRERERDRDRAMGIPGLLRVVKSIVRPIHVKAYAGKKVAIDAYSWLHRGTYSCAKELCLGTPTDKYVQYCMHMVRMLKHHGVHPVLIFDGARLPSKSSKEGERRQSRKEKMERGLAHLHAGNERAAYECFQKAVDVTPTMAWRVAEACKEEGGVECMVAPYEADAQMAFLARTGYVHAVISEDSDLIPYGCPRMLYKMDKFGSGEELLWSELSRTPDVDWFGFNSDMIVLTCVISGCDYLDGVHGIGVKKASRLVKDVRTSERVLRSLRLDSKVNLPGDYEDQFYRAILTFRYHYVYDPVEKEMVHLSPLAEMDAAGRDLSFLGEVIEDKETLIGVCGECVLDPMSKTPFSSLEETPRKKQTSIKGMC